MIIIISFCRLYRTKFFFFDDQIFFQFFIFKLISLLSTCLIDGIVMVKNAECFRFLIDSGQS